jgi:hypothetical protein
VAITLVTVLAMIVIWGSLAYRERRRPRPAPGNLR